MHIGFVRGRRANETIKIFLDFLKFNLPSHLGTLRNLKVFCYNIPVRKVITKRSVPFSANIVHASTPASSEMVAAVWVGKRNETLIVSHSVLLCNELSQLLKNQTYLLKESETMFSGTLVSHSKTNSDKKYKDKFPKV